jgi:hypothetical protein
MKRLSGNNKSIIHKVHEKAVELLLKANISDNPLIKKSGKVETPIPIYDSEDVIVSWFVGITVMDRIVSFIQFDQNLEFMRYSTFLHKNASLEGCPKAITWLNPVYIRKLARTKASADEILSTPFMTYDRNLSRIVWAVKASKNHNSEKTIFVSGQFVYVQP